MSRSFIDKFSSSQSSANQSSGLVWDISVWQATCFPNVIRGEHNFLTETVGFDTKISEKFIPRCSRYLTQLLVALVDVLHLNFLCYVVPEKVRTNIHMHIKIFK